MEDEKYVTPGKVLETFLKAKGYSNRLEFALDMNWGEDVVRNLISGRTRLTSQHIREFVDKGLIEKGDRWFKLLGEVIEEYWYYIIKKEYGVPIKYLRMTPLYHDAIPSWERPLYDLMYQEMEDLWSIYLVIINEDHPLVEQIKFVPHYRLVEMKKEELYNLEHPTLPKPVPTQGLPSVPSLMQKLKKLFEKKREVPVVPVRTVYVQDWPWLTSYWKET